MSLINLQTGARSELFAAAGGRRQADLIEHEVATLVGKRVFGIALGGACPWAGEAGPGGGPERP